jgi:hypothetical protein
MIPALFTRTSHPAEATDGSLDDLGHHLLVAQVADNRNGGSACCADLLDRLLGAGPVQVRDQNLRTFLCELQGCGPADPDAAPVTTTPRPSRSVLVM